MQTLYLFTEILLLVAEAAKTESFPAYEVQNR